MFVITVELIDQLVGYESEHDPCFRFQLMNSSAYGQSREQITEMMSAKMLLQGATGLREVRLEGIRDVSCVEVFNDTLYVGTHDSMVCVFELTKAKNEEQELVATSERSFYPHCTRVHFIVASSLLLIAVPLEEQQLIRIWNRQTLQILHGYKGHGKQITQVIFLKDRQHIASSSYDGTVRIWKITQKFEFDLEIRKYTSKYPLLTVVEQDEQTVAFGGDDCFISVWNWSQDMLKHKCFAHPGSVISLSISHPYIFSMGGDSRIRVWKSEEILRTSEILNEEINPSGQKLTLVPIKQFNQTVAQNVFSLHLSNHEVLAIDCKGNTFLITRHLEAITSRLKLDYSESIRSAKLWQNRLLVVISRRGKGELKEMGGEFQEMVQKASFPRNFVVSTNAVRVDNRSKHSIAIENDSSYKELDKLPQFIIEHDP